MRKISKKSS